MLKSYGVLHNDGVAISSRNGIEYDQVTKRLIFTDADPWLMLKINCLAKEGTLLGELRLVAKHDQADRLNGKICLNYGEGWSEENCITFPLRSEVIVPVLLARPDLLEIRLDPDDRRNEVASLCVEYHPIDSVDQLSRVVYGYAIHRSDWRDATLVATILFESWSSDELPSTKVALLGTKYLASQCMRYNSDQGHDYGRWLKTYIDPNSDDYAYMRKMMQDFAIRPKYSFVIPLYNTPIDLLDACLKSITAQVYENFEICVADDCSTDAAVRAYMRNLARQDHRVRYVERSANGHISAASNSALGLATGEFIVLVDHDDLIPDYALFVVNYYLNANPQAKILFSDEDKVDALGRRSDPYFKGCFDRFLMFGHNMVSHLGVYKRELIARIQGFRHDLEGSQDYDLFFRCYESVLPSEVIHIPHVLYHWRMTPGSTAISAGQKDYAFLAAMNAINGHFERTSLPLRSIPGVAPGNAAVCETRTYDDRVTIIIPTKDNVGDLRDCVDSILSFDNKNVDIIIVDNRSISESALGYFKEIKSIPEIRVIRFDEEFNYSRINNFAVEHARGDIICFLNDDTVIRRSNWLNRARCFLNINNVGIVGARLLYEDETLQHFGIYLGMGSHGVASIPHLGIAASAFGYFSKARLLHSVSAVTGACLFVRRELFKQVGGFDEDLAVAYNDVDLCLKVRARGYEIVCDPEILLTHKESRSRGYDTAGPKAARLDREARKMRLRWGEVLTSDPYVSPNIALDRTDFAYAQPPRIKMPWQPPS